MAVEAMALRDLPLLEQVQVIEQIILRDRFIEPKSQHHVNFFAHVLAVVGHASTLTWLYLPDFAPEQINLMLSDFLRMRVKPIEPCIRKIYVDVLQTLKSTIQSGWYFNIRYEHAVDSEASFVETMLHNLVEIPTKNTVVIDVGLLVYSLYEDEEEKEDMAPGKVNQAQVLDLSGNIQSLSIVIYLTIRKAFQSNLPRIHGLGYVDIFLDNLKEFQRRHSLPLASAVDEFQIIQKEFESFQPFLEAVAEERHNDLDKIQHCATQLIGNAHEVEFIVDACINKIAPVGVPRVLALGYHRGDSSYQSRGSRDS
ncbi:hypothetical protein K7X08_014003 [Anisodus acutangulus]|uniref:Late blight resistance protein R1A-like N-terminal domain-containing protein n=1 Tax=Anisodus acutangulus TaxID=402998 RepID=A0A9Q1LLA0_9SOLA|nr:hypothetical protein K7X08_014003 [Anisodus acutangulus]